MEKNAVLLMGNTQALIQQYTLVLVDLYHFIHIFYNKFC